MTSLSKAYEGTGAPVVYVNSGSTDGSLDLAKSLGAEVVELDMSVPFTAARARNAGVARLREILPALAFIQFIDGDCELDPAWPGAAMTAITARNDIAVVCGRRREIHPDQSIYNQLCDMEWNTPIGEALACGGDSLMRADAFAAAGGFRDDLIAGEEPELCFRLRSQGWRILRIDHEMTRHDADIHRFGQWWKRAKRSGHAIAEGWALHGASSERYNAARLRSTLFWGLGLPVLTLFLTIAASPWSLLLLLGYPVLFWRIRTHRRSRNASPRAATIYAIFCVIGKFAELTGMALYCFRRLGRTQLRIIEYK